MDPLNNKKYITKSINASTSHTYVERQSCWRIDLALRVQHSMLAFNVRIVYCDAQRVFVEKLVWDARHVSAQCGWEVSACDVMCERMKLKEK